MAATAAPGRRRAEAGPDPRRRAGSRLGRQDPAQDDDAAVRPSEHQLQKPVRIHAGAQISVTATTVAPGRPVSILVTGSTIHKS